MRTCNQLLTVVGLVGLGGIAANAAVVSSITDTFDGAAVDSSIFNVTNRGIESNADGGYDAPTQTNGQVTLGGKTSVSYWAGRSLETVDKLDPTLVETIGVERVSLTGSGSAYRSSLWVVGSGGQYLHFAYNTENGWEYNCNGCTSATAGNSGTPVGAFNALGSPLGDHEMELVYIPSGTGAVVTPYLDGIAGPAVSFASWGGTGNTLILTGQARAANDTVEAVFDNFSATTPEPASLSLLGLGALGLLARRRR